MLCIFRNEYVPPIELLAILKAHIPQRRDEMLRRDGRESRKKLWDGIWLNPKCHNNRSSAAKLRIGEGSTTNRLVAGVGGQANGPPK